MDWGVLFCERTSRGAALEIIFMLGNRFDNKVSNFIEPNEVFGVPGGHFLHIKQKSLAQRAEKGKLL